jgi:formate/nitrite transporter FocA (FNT family)
VQPTDLARATPGFADDSAMLAVRRPPALVTGPGGGEAARGIAAQADSLTWTGFVLRNLVPVTLGNIVGGSLLVGAVYWFVYIGPQPEREGRS